MDVLDIQLHQYLCSPKFRHRANIGAINRTKNDQQILFVFKRRQARSDHLWTYCMGSQIRVAATFTGEYQQSKCRVLRYQVFPVCRNRRIIWEVFGGSLEHLENLFSAVSLKISPVSVPAHCGQPISTVVQENTGAHVVDSGCVLNFAQAMNQSDYGRQRW